MARIGGHATALAARASLARAVAVLGRARAASDPRLAELVCGGTDTENPETQRWVRLILDVATAAIVPDLLDDGRRTGAHERVCAETALSFDAAQWAIEAWCEALGVDAPPEAAFSPPGRIRPRRAAPGDAADRPSVPELKLEAAASIGPSPLQAAAWSPEGGLVAGAGADHVVRVWRLGDPAGTRMLARHDGPVVALAFSADGDILASGSSDGTVRLSRPEPGTSLGVLTAHAAGVSALAFNPTGNLLATASDSGAVTLWDPHQGTAARKIRGHTAAVSAVAFRAGGRVLVTGGEDDTVRMWLSASGTAGHVLPLRGPVTAMAMDPAGARLAVSRRLGFSVRRFAWPADISPITATLGAMLRGDVFFLTGAPWASDSAGIRVFAFDPGGDLLAAGATNGTVSLWRAATGSPVGRGGGHDGPVLAVGFDPEGMGLISVGGDGSVRSSRWRP